MKQRGFTLLETIIALVLISSVGMALLSWVHSNIMNLQQVRNANERNQAIRNTLSFMDTINPSLLPTGEHQLGMFLIRWQANLIDGPKDGVNMEGRIGYFQLALFDNQITILKDEQILTQFSLRQAGYQQVRSPEDTLRSIW
jgi:general secretion pathway protein I